MSSILTNTATALRPLRLPALAAAGDPDLGLRSSAARLGHVLGWASLAVVAAGLVFDAGSMHRSTLVVATLVAGAGNAASMLVPWRDWLATRRGLILLDLWCGGLVAFVALLVLEGGSSFALLLFLTVPFIAVVQRGRRRTFWLAAAATTCLLVARFASLPAGATAMRLALVAATVGIALFVVRAVGREVVARERATSRVELERTLAREASHRIKNDLQTAADLLLLGRPAGDDGAAFDETAARIRSIAAVHRLLTESQDRVDGGTLLRQITAGVPMSVTVEAEPSSFDAATAQKLGLVANELVTNAFRHGTAPIVMHLSGGDQTTLSVENGGTRDEAPGGFGIDLVRSVVEHGLHGRFELQQATGGGMRAEVVFPTVG